MIDNFPDTLIDSVSTNSSCSPEQTIEIATKLSNCLKAGDIVAFEGPLGAGKTTFIKGLIAALCLIDPNEIASPTFTYLHIYPRQTPVHHFDLYRITSQEQFLMLGLNDHINSNSISLIEWPDRAPSYTSCANIHVQLSYTSPNERSIVIQRKNA